MDTVVDEERERRKEERMLKGKGELKRERVGEAEEEEEETCCNGQPAEGQFLVILVTYPYWKWGDIRCLRLPYAAIRTSYVFPC